MTDNEKIERNLLLAVRQKEISLEEAVILADVVEWCDKKVASRDVLLSYNSKSFDDKIFAETLSRGMMELYGMGKRPRQQQSK